ncbi:MAG TPA: sensor histidine kinase [Acidimicrobiales bacterium]|nr:sensor histidine kinase [Acidimicrobiales bacterium]
MIPATARSLWAEPRVPNAPKRLWWDWVLVAAVLVAAVIEAVVREDVVWRPVNLILVVAVAPLLLWRRTHPLAMVAIVFPLFAVVDLVATVVGVTWDGPNPTALVILLFPYALFRWGSGREATIGLAIVLSPVVAGAAAAPVGEVVGGALILMFAAALGAAVRFRSSARLHGRDQAKLREREQLARELHDTVAHHVSAIAIQAQAGRTVAESHPEAVLDALVVVEKEASRALTEMRTIVGALREGEQAALAPQPGVADIERLRGATGHAPHVDVTLTGDLDELPPSVDAALYRLAQESVTNALRHARHATRINVVVTGEDDCVRLTVWDDGDARPVDAESSSGFGLLGMAERARLLGGAFEAGPNRDGGWTVHAELPKSGRGA